MRPQSALASLLVGLLAASFAAGAARCQSGTASSEERYRDDPDVWRFGNIGGPHDRSSERALPPPIVPTHWLVMPRSAWPDEEQLLVRTALDPDAPLPRVATATDDGRDPRMGFPRTIAWEAFEGAEGPDALVAFTTIESKEDDVRMARLGGAELLFVNGEGFAGDPDRRGFGGVPIALRKGANRVFVAGIRGPFALELSKPPARLVIGAWDAAWPGYGARWPEPVEASFPLFNASVATARSVQLHFGDPVDEDGTRKPHLSDWRDGAVLPPLGMFLASIGWERVDNGPRTGGVEIAPVCAWDDGRDADRRILRRDPRASGLLTSEFVPRDASQRPRSWIARSFEPVAYVYGTRGTDEETRALLALARLDQELAWYRTRGTPLVATDE